MFQLNKLLKECIFLLEQIKSLNERIQKFKYKFQVLFFKLGGGSQQYWNFKKAITKD